MIKNTLFVTLSIIASAALGFLSQLLFAAKFGVSQEMDLHFRIVSIPSMVTATSSVIFASVFIPFFSRLKSNKIEYKEVAKNIWLSVFIAVLLFIIISLILSVTYIGKEGHEIIADRSRLIFFISLFVSIGAGSTLMSGYLSSLLNFEKRFLTVAWTAVLPALFIIICVILLDDEIGVISISLGYAIGFFIQFIVLLYASNLGLRIDKIKLKKIPDLVGLLIKSILVFLALLPFSITAPVAYYWASEIEVGSISYIGYSLALSGFLSVVVSMGLSTVTFPDLAEKFANNREKSNQIKFQHSLHFVLMFAIFLAGLIISLRTEIITILYERGSFNSNSVENLSMFIVWFYLSAVFTAGLNLIRTLLFARNENIKLAIIGVVFSLFYFILSGILKEFLHLNGIGIANLICFALLFIVCVHIARNKNHGFLGISLYIFLVKNITTASISYLAIYFSLNFIVLNLSLAVKIIIGVFLYSSIYLILALFIFKIREVNIFRRSILSI
jgi:putative peptidoglycan lipid II flippase